MFFQPKYRLGHPENYLFLLSKRVLLGSKYPKKYFINFENNFTDFKARYRHLRLLQRFLNPKEC